MTILGIGLGVEWSAYGMKMSRLKSRLQVFRSIGERSRPEPKQFDST